VQTQPGADEQQQWQAGRQAARNRQVSATTTRYEPNQGWHAEGRAVRRVVVVAVVVLSQRWLVSVSLSLVSAAAAPLRLSRALSLSL